MFRKRIPFNLNSLISKRIEQKGQEIKLGLLTFHQGKKNHYFCLLFQIVFSFFRINSILGFSSYTILRKMCSIASCRAVLAESAYHIFRSFLLQDTDCGFNVLSSVEAASQLLKWGWQSAFEVDTNLSSAYADCSMWGFWILNSETFLVILVCN